MAPTSPLAWDVRTLDGRDLPTCLPDFFSEVDEVRSGDRSLSDFGVIDEVVRRAAAVHATVDPAAGWSDEGWTAAKIDAEARHFLGLAYSALDGAPRSSRELETWHWYRWIEALGTGLLATISFNDDTLFERTLERAGIPYFHLGIEPQDGVPLGKPHGSVDYALAENAIVVGGGPNYPINVAIGLANTPMRRLPAADLTIPRLHVEVVPPIAATRIRWFQWVWPIFDAFARIGFAIERCAFVGLSAWGVDQPELRDVLYTLTPRAEIVVANPDPRPRAVIEFHARRLGLTQPVWRWPAGPPSTP